MGTPILFDKVGLEVEVFISSQEVINKLLGKRDLGGKFSFSGDASCETIVLNLGGINIFNYRTSPLGRAGRLTKIGGEIVSLPLTPEEASVSIPPLLFGLSRSGELDKNLRSSIHIHVGFPQSLVAMKKAVMFEEKFEKLLYHIGGMGYTFRGLENNSIYCRPFSTKYGPPVVQGTNGEMYPILVTKELYKAKSIEEFWLSYGVITGNFNRYHPSRYFGLNLLSLLLHQTLEFRFFNFTTNAIRLLAVVNLVQGMSELIFKIPMKVLEQLPDNPVFLEKYDDRELLETLFGLCDNFCDDHPVTNKDIIRRMVYSSSAPTLELKYIKTHLFNKFSLGEQFLFSGGRYKVENAEDSGFIDVHNESVTQDLIKVANY